jgi:hypothetical protein
MTDVTIANDTPRQLGVVRSYADLHAVLRERAEALDVSRESIDYASGLQNGYSSKILSPRPRKRLGPLSMQLMLETLGLALVVVEDQAAVERITRKLPKREVRVPMQAVLRENGRHAQSPNVVSLRHLRKIARKGGEAYARKASSATKRRVAKAGAKARWARPRVTEITS